MSILLGYNIEANLDGSSEDAEAIEQQTQHVLSSIDAQEPNPITIIDTRSGSK